VIGVQGVEAVAEVPPDICETVGGDHGRILACVEHANAHLETRVDVLPLALTDRGRCVVIGWIDVREVEGCGQEF
jgi:hypothetical protein